MKKMIYILFSVWMLMFCIGSSAQTQYISPSSVMRRTGITGVNAIKTVAQSQDTLISLWKVNNQTGNHFFCRTKEGTANMEIAMIPFSQSGAFINRLTEIKDFSIIDGNIYLCGQSQYNSNIYGAFVSKISIEDLFNHIIDTVETYYFRDISEFEKLDIISSDRIVLIADSSYYYDLNFSTGQYSKHSYDNRSVLDDISHTDNYICVFAHHSDNEIVLFRHNISNVSIMSDMSYTLSCVNTNYTLTSLSNDSIAIGFLQNNVYLGYMTIHLPSMTAVNVFHIEYPMALNNLNDMIFTTTGNLLILANQRLSSSNIQNTIIILNPYTVTSYITYGILINDSFWSNSTELISLTDFSNNRYAALGNSIISWYDNNANTDNSNCHSVLPVEVSIQECIRSMQPINTHKQVNSSAPRDILIHKISAIHNYSKICY